MSDRRNPLQPDRRKLLPRDGGRREGDPRTGREAYRSLLELAAREEYLAVELVARALSLSSRQVMRDWRRRKAEEKKIGRTVLLKSDDVIAIYFRTPSSGATSA